MATIINESQMALELRRRTDSTVHAAPQSEPIPEWERVVIHLRGEIIKGTVQALSAHSHDGGVTGAPRALSTALSVRRIGSDIVEEIPINEAKAVFFVKTFDGDPLRRDLRFHTGGPIMQALWVRVEFSDSEVLEGLVDNSHRFLIDEGFFLRPTDPRSNNRLIYVQKSWIKDCRVLGLRDMWDASVPF